jgi:hypothetical protein
MSSPNAKGKALHLPRKISKGIMRDENAINDVKEPSKAAEIKNANEKTMSPCQKKPIGAYMAYKMYSLAGAARDAHVKEITTPWRSQENFEYEIVSGGPELKTEIPRGQRSAIKKKSIASQAKRAAFMPSLGQPEDSSNVAREDKST